MKKRLTLILVLGVSFAPSVFAVQTKVKRGEAIRCAYSNSAPHKGSEEAPKTSEKKSPRSASEIR